MLGVARDAPTAEIRRAYVTLARSIHPDVRGDDPAADEQMRRINLAWEMLSDDASRAAVDRRLRQPPRAAPVRRDSPTARPHEDSRRSDEEVAYDRDVFDGGDYFEDNGDHFDGDDRPLTEGDLPAWMRLGAPLAFVFGIFAVIFGVLAGGFVLVRFGLLSLGLSVLLFLLSPFVVLVRSRGRPMR